MTNTPEEKKEEEKRQVREREKTRCNTAKPSKPRPNMAAPKSRHTARETVVNSDPETELMRNGTHIDRKMGGVRGGGGGGAGGGHRGPSACQPNTLPLGHTGSHRGLEVSQHFA